MIIITVYLYCALNCTVAVLNYCISVVPKLFYIYRNLKIRRKNNSTIILTIPESSCYKHLEVISKSFGCSFWNFVSSLRGCAPAPASYANNKDNTILRRMVVCLNGKLGDSTLNVSYLLLNILLLYSCFAVRTCLAFVTPSAATCALLRSWCKGLRDALGALVILLGNGNRREGRVTEGEKEQSLEWVVVSGSEWEWVGVSGSEWEWVGRNSHKFVRKWGSRKR